jgi:hypothetical protein
LLLFELRETFLFLGGFLCLSLRSPLYGENRAYVKVGGAQMKSVKDYIISIPDFPSKGIIFRDVTSVLESPEGYALAIDELNKLLDGVDYDLIAGTESRGIFWANCELSNLCRGGNVYHCCAVSI